MKILCLSFISTCRVSKTYFIILKNNPPKYILIVPKTHPKLDSLRPGSREKERGRREGQNFQLEEVQRLEEEEEEVVPKHAVTHERVEAQIY